MADGPAKTDLMAKNDALKDLIAQAKGWFVDGVMGADHAEMLALFAMPGVRDGKVVVGGNAYGILLHTFGIAVNHFVQEHKGNKTNNIFLLILPNVFFPNYVSDSIITLIILY